MGGVLLARVIQLAALAQRLVVDRQRHRLHVHELVVGDGHLVEEVDIRLLVGVRELRARSGMVGAAACWPDRSEGLVALLDEVLQLSQHRDLGVLHFQLLGGGVCDAGPVGGLRFTRLHANATGLCY